MKVKDIKSKSMSQALVKNVFLTLKSKSLNQNAVKIVFEILYQNYFKKRFFHWQVLKIMGFVFEFGRKEEEKNYKIWLKLFGLKTIFYEFL